MVYSLIDISIHSALLRIRRNTLDCTHNCVTVKQFYELEQRFKECSFPPLEIPEICCIRL